MYIYDCVVVRYNVRENTTSYNWNNLINQKKAQKATISLSGKEPEMQLKWQYSNTV